jgi:hypothetical protein
MENPASKHTEIPNFTAFFRNAEDSERSPRRRTVNKKAAPTIVGQLRKYALEPRVAAIKMEIDRTRINGKSSLVTWPRYQPSQRTNLNRQYQQKTTCTLSVQIIYLTLSGRPSSITELLRDFSRGVFSGIRSGRMNYWLADPDLL